MKATTYASPKANEIPNLPKDAPKLQPLFVPRDKQLKEHSQILQNQVSRTDNTNSDPKELSIRHDTNIDIEFNPELIRADKATTVELEEMINLFDHHKLAWQNIGDNKVRVNVKFDSAPTTAVDVRIRIWGP